MQKWHFPWAQDLLRWPKHSPDAFGAPTLSIHLGIHQLTMLSISPHDMVPILQEKNLKVLEKGCKEVSYSCFRLKVSNVNDDSEIPCKAEMREESVYTISLSV